MSIYAFDFDGTLCNDCYPEIGAPNSALIHYALRLRGDGHKLILWTCRAGERLDEAVSWCMHQGLTFDCINENLPEIVHKYGSDSRKITADYYIDDRSILPNDVCEHLNCD